MTNPLTVHIVSDDNAHVERVRDVIKIGNKNNVKILKLQKNKNPEESYVRQNFTEVSRVFFVSFFFSCAFVT